MKRICSCLVVCLSVLSGGPGYAQPNVMDPVVVTATRTKTPLSQVASSVTVITREEIESKQQPMVIDLLRSVPGVSVTRSGGPGGTATVFLRGAESKHTLVLIDGVEINNPVAVGGVANLANLTSDDIQQIEIVRGAQSVLYGSDAIGGVINIITRKGKAAPAGYARVEGGSYNTLTEQVGFSTGSKQGQVAFAASHSKSGGYSAASEKNGNSEDDGYKNRSFTLNAGVRPVELFELNFTGSYRNASYEYDNGFSTPPSDAANLQKNRELTARLEGILHLLADRWQLKLGASYTDLKNETDEESWGLSTYDGKKRKLDLQNIFTLDNHHTLVVGMEKETDYAKTSNGQNDSVDNKAIYAEEQLKYGSLSSVVGLRYDRHDEFGGHTTWRVAPSYQLATDTRIKGSVGTGFKAPTLYELYAPGFADWLDPSIIHPVGNRDLSPEKSLSWDLGIEQGLLKNKLVIEVSWFQNRIKDFIDYDFATGYVNTNDIRTQGVESTLSIYPCSFADLQLGYTYTDTKNLEDGSRLLRRPLHQGTLDVNIYPLDAMQVNLYLLYVGERDDYPDLTLAAYTLVNLATSYQLNDNCTIFGRIDNIFDEDYEEVAGYGTAGVSGYAGVKLMF